MSYFILRQFPQNTLGANEGAIKGAQTDYGSTMVQWMQHQGPKHRKRSRLEQERPSPSYVIDMLPPAARVCSPGDTIPAKLLHSSLNKIKHPVNIVKWTPEGRRLLTGSSSGEFTLWHGMGFNFETIMQAHDSAIRAAVWSHSDDWLLSADQDGILKYWQPNFNNVKEMRAHEAPIRDLAFAPTDTKFVTGSDDATLKVWDFSAAVAESEIKGHGWDVKSVDWHPTKGLLVSGSKDHQVKLWDPRNGRCLTTLHGHKNTISKVSFERCRGDALATCARDSVARVFDIRMMRDVLLLRGHDKDIISLCWHPIHSSMLSTGGSDGSLFHYLLDEPNPPPGTSLTISPYDSPDPHNAPAQIIYPAHRIPFAHESSIWSMDWHPLGHILASGSNDRVTRFWTRARPGETECFTDRYHLGETAAEAHGTWNRKRYGQQARDEEEQELEDEADGLVDQKMPARSTMPGLTGLRNDGTSVGGGQPQLPGMGTAMPLVTSSLMPPPQAMDASKLAELLGGGMPLMPPPNGLSPGSGQVPPPSLAQFGTFQKGGFPAGMIPPGFPPPVGLSAPGYAIENGTRPTSSDANGNGGGVRRRAPLPSQQEMMEEMRKGGVRGGR